MMRFKMKSIKLEKIFLLIVSLISFAGLTAQIEDNRPYVSFKLPDTFPTRIIIPSVGITFDVYKTDQTLTNYRWKHTLSIKDREIKKLYATLEEADRYTNAILESQIKSNRIRDSMVLDLNNELKARDEKIDILFKSNQLLYDDKATLVLALKKARHKSFFTNLFNFGYGPFRIKYILAGFAGYKICDFINKS